MTTLLTRPPTAASASSRSFGVLALIFLISTGCSGGPDGGPAWNLSSGWSVGGSMTDAELWVDSAKLHLFDPDSGANLGH